MTNRMTPMQLTDEELARAAGGGMTVEGNHRKTGSVAIEVPRETPFGYMDKAGIRAAEALMRTDPSVDMVDINVRSDQGDFYRTSSGGWTRESMESGSIDGGALPVGEVQYWNQGEGAPQPFGPNLPDGWTPADGMRGHE